MNDRAEGNPLFIPNRRRRRSGNCRSALIVQFLCFVGFAALATTIIDNAILGYVLVAAFSVDPMSSPTATKNACNGPSESPVILVIGSCGLDRLLGVSSYPVADSKIRTTSYTEVGGGNAANTASGMFFQVHGNSNWLIHAFEPLYSRAILSVLPICSVLQQSEN